MIVKSILDLDFYKLTMGNVVFHRYPTAEVDYKFVCRNKDVNLLPYLEDIQEEIKSLETLSLTDSELKYLSKITFLDPAFIRFMGQLRLHPEDEVYVYNDGNNLGIKIEGSWLQVIWYETMILAIVNEIYFRDKIPKDFAIKTAKERLYPKVDLLEKNPEVKISDFGTRRRHSFEVQELVVSTLKYLPNFMGTSNVHLAMKYNLKPIGTMAHEYISAHQAITRVQDSQKMALDVWAKDFDGNLGIALTDTINMDAFLKDFTRFYAKLFDGCRHDSGDPVIWGEKLIEHYKGLGINPTTKTIVFSDGLDVPYAIRLYDHFKGKINVAFGIGTNLTNDIGLKALNIVIKMSKCNDQPVAKISDNASKNICDDPVYVAYLKSAFGIKS